MRMIGPCCLALGLMTLVTGCMTGALHRKTDAYSSAEPGSSQWWAEKAALPPGVRSNCKKGKVWPARPRSTGDKQQFSHTFHSAHYWPLPYVCQDREYVHNVMELQMNEGWQQETTLYAATSILTRRRLRVPVNYTCNAFWKQLHCVAATYSSSRPATARLTIFASPTCRSPWPACPATRMRLPSHCVGDVNTADRRRKYSRSMICTIPAFRFHVFPEQLPLQAVAAERGVVAAEQSAPKGFC